MDTLKHKLLSAAIWTLALFTLSIHEGYVIVIIVCIGVAVISIPFIVYSKKKPAHPRWCGLLYGVWAALFATAITQRHEDIPGEISAIAKNLISDPIVLALLIAPVWIDVVIALMNRRITKEAPTCASTCSPEDGAQ
jgi:hypothetical protein